VFDPSTVFTALEVFAPPLPPFRIKALPAELFVFELLKFNVELVLPELFTFQDPTPDTPRTPELFALVAVVDPLFVTELPELFKLVADPDPVKIFKIPAELLLVLVVALPPLKFKPLLLEVVVPPNPAPVMETLERSPLYVLPEAFVPDVKFVLLSLLVVADPEPERILRIVVPDIFPAPLPPPFILKFPFPWEAVPPVPDPIIPTFPDKSVFVDPVPFPVSTEAPLFAFVPALPTPPVMFNRVVVAVLVFAVAELLFKVILLFP